MKERKNEHDIRIEVRHCTDHADTSMLGCMIEDCFPGSPGSRPQARHHAGPSRWYDLKFDVRGVVVHGFLQRSHDGGVVGVVGWK